MLDLKSFLSGGGHRIKLKRHEYIRAGLWMLFFFGVIFLFVLEVKYFSNTFQVKSMIKRAFLIGAVMGIGLSYWLTRNKPDMETLLKFQLWVAVLIGCVLMMPLVASLTNRYLSFDKMQEVPVELVKIDGFYSNRFGLPDGEVPKADGFHIFFLKDGQLERIKSPVNPFPEAKEGETVLLPIKPGFWGYDYVMLK